jgi:hypothetical protein
MLASRTVRYGDLLERTDEILAGINLQLLLDRPPELPECHRCSATDDDRAPKIGPLMVEVARETRIEAKRSNHIGGTEPDIEVLERGCGDRTVETLLGRLHRVVLDLVLEELSNAVPVHPILHYWAKLTLLEPADRALAFA